jgi:hypothetical protein
MTVYEYSRSNTGFPGTADSDMWVTEDVREAHSLASLAASGASPRKPSLPLARRPAPVPISPSRFPDSGQESPASCQGVIP